MSRGRGLAGPACAIGLLVVIVRLAFDVIPLVRAELRLRRAADLAAENPVKGFFALERGSALERLSPRQVERGNDLARAVLSKVRGGRPLLKLVGPHEFDPAGSGRSYATTSTNMMLLFELPPNLRALGSRIRVAERDEDLCEVAVTEDGASGLGEVPLPPDRPVIADVDLVCPVGSFGTITAPIAHGLRLLRKTSGPALRLWSTTGSHDLREGETLHLQIDRGTPLRLEISDELGVRSVQWSIDGVRHDPIAWQEDGAASRRSTDLPAALTATAARARVLDLRASDPIATSHAAVELAVRDPSVPPVAQVRIDRQEIEAGKPVRVAEEALTLSVLLAVGEVAADLSVVWDDRPLKVHSSGPEATSLLTAETEGVHSLLLKVRNNPVFACAVVTDRTPPAVSAIVDPGRGGRELEVRRAVHDLPTGATVVFTVSDAVGVDVDGVDFQLKGSSLEEAHDESPASRSPEPQRTWSRRFRCTEPGDAVVQVSAMDVAGNHTTIHEYRIRVADPMEGRSMTVNGEPFAPGAVLHARLMRFSITTEGGIDLDALRFSVLDPKQSHATVCAANLRRGDRQGTMTGSCDLGFVAASGTRLVGVLASNERELVKGEIVVDFMPPAFKVTDPYLDPAGEHGGVPRFRGDPGQQIALTLGDDVGVDLRTISVLRGAEIVAVNGETDIGVVLRLPAALDEPVVMTAADFARNQVEFRFEVVPRTETETRVAVVSPPEVPGGLPVDGGPAPPARAPTLAELAGSQRVVHPLLGTFHLVPVNDPAVPPFYIGEHEVSIKEWRAFVGSLPGAAIYPADPGGARRQALLADATRVLNYNLNVLQGRDEHPAACMSPEVVKGYVDWANAIARDLGVWRVPTETQWRLAAGRATHPGAAYPTTGAFPGGNDLTNEGSGGALFDRDAVLGREAPRRDLAAGAYGLRNMAGSLYEWVVDSKGYPRLIGGSLGSTKDACRLNAPLRSAGEVKEPERGLRLVLLPRAR